MSQIEEADTDAELKTGWVLDNFPKTRSQMNALQQAGILPDILFCLKDSDGNQGRRHRNNASQTFFNNIFGLELSFLCLLYGTPSLLHSNVFKSFEQIV